MFWQEDLEVQHHSHSMCHIDVWINNWLEDQGYFLGRFYGQWNVAQRKHSWELNETNWRHKGFSVVYPRRF